MTDPRGIRRRARITIVFVWLLVCGGLTWATWAAVRLDDLERAAANEKADARIMALALTRLDAVIEPILARERARPYSHFRSRFKLARAFDSVDGAELNSRIVVPSPLQRVPEPDWLLFHFQVSESQGWTSPQIAHPVEGVEPAGAIPAVHRRKEAAPENWLAALKARYPLPQLLQEFENALAVEVAARQQSAHGKQGESSRVADRTRPPLSDALVPGATEAAKRAARLYQLERENFPLSWCEPERVALENLQTGVEAAEPKEGAADCVQVLPNLMMPVWLDLTLDDRLQLAWIRSVTVENSRYCTLQGVLLDWERLREVLLAELPDLLPGARISPVPHLTFEDRLTSPYLLQTIPARLEIPGPLRPNASLMSSSLGTGLAVSWGATLLALAAISYGVLKYVGMTERRMQFVAAVTHELRTPLTSFQLYSDLLAELPPDQGDRKDEFVQRLQGESRRLARLVENVLAYSRIGMTRPTLDRRRVLVHEILEATVTAAGPGCSERGRTLAIENDCRADASLETDVTLTVQILTNLIENACKYASDAPNPTIWLRAAPHDAAGLVFEVEDAGKGVAPRDRRTVFEPFYRGRGAQESAAGGIGLGLALSRHWAQCLGGDLSVRRGTRNTAALACFSLTLPASPTA